MVIFFINQILNDFNANLHANKASKEKSFLWWRAIKLQMSALHSTKLTIKTFNLCWSNQNMVVFIQFYSDLYSLTLYPIPKVVRLVKTISKPKKIYQILAPLKRYWSPQSNISTLMSFLREFLFLLFLLLFTSGSLLDVGYDLWKVHAWIL